MVLSDFLLFSSSCPLIFQSDHFGLSRDRSFRLANAPSKAAVSSTGLPVLLSSCLLYTSPLCFQWISDNRKAGKYPASLCNGVDESDCAYPDIIVRMRHRHCSPNTKPISASASSIFSMNSGTISSKLAMYFSSRSITT